VPRIIYWQEDTMKSLQMIIASALFIAVGTAGAAGNQQGHKKHGYKASEASYEYAEVLNARPIYREVRVSEPIRECWEEPVYHTQQQPKSAGGMLVGGLIGGVVGHQVGGGRGNKIATAMGVLLGAKIGHDAVNGHIKAERRVVGYEEHCKTQHRVSYEERLDGYDVTYEYRGREYQLVMPYHPGEHIKMRIEFAPVI
jgi:uncharacterized protein YcfJ